MPNYNAIITEFQAELESLLEQKDQLTERIAELAKAIDAIKVLAEEDGTLNPPPLKMDSETGFTDRVRAVLKANPAMALSALVIRDEFLKNAPEDDPKILLIHTHNTLKRLHRQGEVVEISTSAGRAYRWKFTYGFTPAPEEVVRKAKLRDLPPPPPDFIEDAMKSMTKKK